MDKKNEIIKKTLVIGILILFIGTVITPTIAGDNSNQDTTTITFYTFDITETKKCKAEISNEIAKEISEIFEELKTKITKYPLSDETKAFKVDFVDLLDANGLIPKRVSKNDVFSLLNPTWLRKIGDKNPLDIDIISRSTTLNDVFPMQSSVSGSAFLCSMAGGGSGIMFPPIIFPRPRLVTVWTAYLDAVTIASNLYTGHGFAAFGSQVGFALGFWGIGLSFAFPGEPAVFGFGGYALAAYVRAEDIETYPPNQVPIISEENPSDGSVNVPNSLSELSFRISDGDGDRMSYTVTTSPDIGSGGGGNVVGGTYSIPVSGLNSDTEYSWRVIVSDGEDSADEAFTFHTAVEAPFVSDPSPVDGDGWVSVNLSELSFRLEDFQSDPMDYTVETVPDIGSGSASGVGDGVYSVDISDLEYTRDYSWFVNVTDGEYWTRRVFGFKTQPIMVFDPFDEGWMYRKQIIINHTKIAGDLSDFPVLVSLVDSDLAAKAQSDGDDVLFMDGSGVANRLFHEIEKYDGSIGDLKAWVNINDISAEEDTNLYMYYGNSGCSGQQYTDKVWDSNYVAVHHMDDVTSSIVYDSTSNYNIGYKNNANDPKESDQGVVGKCQQHNTDNNYIRMYDDDSLDVGTGDATLEIWLKTTSNFWENFYYSDDISDYNKISFLKLDESYNCVGQIFIRGNSWNEYSHVRGSTGLNDNDWHHIVGTIDNSQAGQNDDLRLFVDGYEEGISSESHEWDGTTLTNSRDKWIGKRKDVNKPFQGYLDEFRLSNYERSDAWISTTFNTISDPSSFFSVGPEEFER